MYAKWQISDAGPFGLTQVSGQCLYISNMVPMTIPIDPAHTVQHCPVWKARTSPPLDPDPIVCSTCGRDEVVIIQAHFRNLVNNLATALAKDGYYTVGRVHDERQLVEVIAQEDASTFWECGFCLETTRRAKTPR